MSQASEAAIAMKFAEIENHLATAQDLMNDLGPMLVAETKEKKIGRFAVGAVRAAGGLAQGSIGKAIRNVANLHELAAAHATPDQTRDGDK